MADDMTRNLGLSSEWISARLRDERARLGMTHAQVAEIAGVSRNAAMAWEKGTAIPSGALALLAMGGFDPQYILVGARSTNIEALREQGAKYRVDPVMTAEEIDWLRSYRGLSDLQRHQAGAMVKVLAAGLPIGGGTSVVSTGENSVAVGRDYRAPGKRKR